MKFIATLLFCLMLLSGCGNNVDEEALTNLSDSLANRWEYTDTLPEEITRDELMTAVQTELDTLKEYGIDDFKDTYLYGKLSSYKSELELVKTQTQDLDFPSDQFEDEWNLHLERRAKILYDINEKHKIDIPEKYEESFEGVLANADRLIEIERIKKDISEIKALDDLKVEIEDNSIVVTYITESALSAKSFVAHKTGFPSKAMDILKKLSEYGYDNMVIATINNQSIAASVYFDKEHLKKVDFDKWDKLDSVDAYKIYDMANAYHIRSGIWEDIDLNTQRLIGDMNKQDQNDFWEYYGFTQ